MKEFPCVKFVKRDIENCLVEVEVCDNVMENPCSIYFLDRRNNQVVKGITDGVKLPIEITRIKLELTPSSMTQYLYSLNGLETIVFNLFRSENKPFQDDLKKGEVYLKTYYKKDEFYTIPVLCLEVIFLRKLHSKTVDNLWKTLKTDLLFFTGNVGDIEFRKIHSISQFEEYLKIPLVVGLPEFKKEGMFKRKYFSEEQLIEMNHVHGISLINLDMNEVINNKYLSLYDEIRDSITSSQYNDDYSQEEVDDVIKSLFTSSLRK